MNRLRGIFKQKYIGKQWGTIVQVSAQGAIFITLINLLLLSVTAFNTTLSPWFKLKGIDLPFWMFMACIIVFLGFLAILLYKFALPSFFSVFNDQFYRHGNLLKRDIELLQADNKKILKKLGEMEKKWREK